MFTAKLKVLGITVPIGINAYHDDGFVTSVREHMRKLARKYPTSDFLEDGKEFGGMSVEGVGFLRRHTHIFYLDYGSEIMNTRVRAHEETHALDHFDRLDLLEQRMLSEQGVRVSFKELMEDEDNLMDRQVRAELGAIYALIKRGFNLDELKGCPEYFGFARGYYERARVKS